jgi:hypothetical protein
VRRRSRHPTSLCYTTDRVIALNNQPLGVPLEFLDRDIEKIRLNHVGTHQFADLRTGQRGNLAKLRLTNGGFARLFVPPAITDENHLFDSKRLLERGDWLSDRLRDTGIAL